MCVVDPSCERGTLGESGSRGPRRTRVRLLGRVHHRDSASAAAPACALEQRHRQGEQRPAGVRRRVRQDLAAAVGGADRLARDRLVAPRGPPPSAAPPRAASQSTTAARDVAACRTAPRPRRRGARSSRPARRRANRSPSRSERARRRETARASGVEMTIAEDLEDVRLLVVERHARRARARAAGAASSASGTVPQRRAASAMPAGIARRPRPTPRRR